MKTWQCKPTYPKVRREPKGYIAYKNNQPIAENQSIALLRHIVKPYGPGVIIKTIR